MKKLGINPNECFMIGDNPTKDVLGAQQLGIKTCFAKHGYLEKYMIPLKSCIPLVFSWRKDFS